MKKIQLELNKKKIWLIIVFTVFLVIAEFFCIHLVQNHAIRLILIWGLSLMDLIFLIFIKFTSVDSIKSFLHSQKNIILSVICIIGLMVSFQSVFINVNKSSVIRSELVLFFIILVLLCICIGILSNNDELQIDHFFAVIFLVLAFLFDLAVPIGEVPDEQSHLETAYQLSNKMMGENCKDSGKLLMRADDAEFKIFQKNVTEQKYKEYLNSASTNLRDDSLVSVKSHALIKTDELYVLPALGITIGRLLHLNSFWTLNLGRIGNLILVCILIALAIRIIPVGKNILFLICLMPTSLQQSMSYSYDAPINAFGILLIAYCIRKICEPDYHPSWIKKVLLIIGIVIILKAKSHAYFLLGLLPIIVWCRGKSKLSQSAKNRLAKSLTIMLILLAGLICLLLFSHLASGLIPETHNFPAMTEGKEGYSLWYIANHASTFLTVITGTIRYAGVTYFTTFFGKWMGWFEIDTGNFSVMLLSATLFLTVISEPEKIDKKDARIICWIISIGMMICVFAGFLLTYTPVDAQYIEGVQGRYFILPMILLLTAIAGKIKQYLKVTQSFYVYVVILCVGTVLFKILAYYA